MKVHIFCEDGDWEFKKCLLMDLVEGRSSLFDFCITRKIGGHETSYKEVMDPIISQGIMDLKNNEVKLGLSLKT